MTVSAVIFWVWLSGALATLGFLARSCTLAIEPGAERPRSTLIGLAILGMAIAAAWPLSAMAYAVLRIALSPEVDDEA